MYGANGVCGYLDYATISAPAILVVKDGSGVGNVLYTNGDCSVVGTLNYLQPKKGVSAKFLYFVLKRFNFQPYKTGMAIPHIYFKAYSKARIFCPEYEEQSRTAASLSRIEDKIALEERLLSLIQDKSNIYCQRCLYEQRGKQRLFCLVQFYQIIGFDGKFSSQSFHHTNEI